MADKVVYDGLVALQHYNSNPCTVVMQEDNTNYNFTPKLNVSMALVKPEHVDALLRQRARMCCGKDQPKFYLASQINFNLWKFGTRHGATEEKIDG